VRKRALAAAAALLALAVPAASAHGPGSAGTGYISTFAALDPPVTGVFVRVLGGTHQLQVANYTGRRVEIYADDIFDHPRWVAIANGTSFRWHERRIRWLGPKPPQVVAAEPDVDHRIFEWKVPGRVGGKPFRILGFLGYRPDAPTAAAGAGFPTWGIALLAAGVAVLVVGAGLGARRLRQRAP
jgi:hypothetical protein